MNCHYCGESHPSVELEGVLACVDCNARLKNIQAEKRIDFLLGNLRKLLELLKVDEGRSTYATSWVKTIHNRIAHLEKMKAESTTVESSIESNVQTRAVARKPGAIKIKKFR